MLIYSDNGVVFLTGVASVNQLDVISILPPLLQPSKRELFAVAAGLSHLCNPYEMVSSYFLGNESVGLRFARVDVRGSDWDVGQGEVRYVGGDIPGWVGNPTPIRYFICI